MRLLCAIAALTTATFAQDQSVGTASITGTVVDALSHIPLKKATITLVSPPGANGQPQQGPPTVTDASGTFSFTGLKPGPYRLTVLKQDYPQAHNNPNKFVTATASDNPQPLDIELAPPASITGQILDEDGDPMHGCAVELRPAERPAEGMNYQNMSAAGGNRDEYRIYGIPPGKYLASAHCNAPVFQPRPFSAGPDPPPSLAYSAVDYPAVIELAPGTERGGVDFRMHPSFVTQVHVTLAPPDLDLRATNLNVRLMPFEAGPQPLFAPPPPSGRKETEFRQVFPGSYLLVASSAVGGNAVGAIQRIEVKDQAVNTVLELKPDIKLSGTIETEDPIANTTGNVQQRSTIQLTGDYPGFPNARNLLPAANAQVKDDGTFEFSVLPGLWHITVTGPVFIRSASLGSKDIAGRSLDLSAGVSDSLKIVVSHNTATIRGTAPPGMSINARDGDEQHFGMANQDGQFKITGVPPGTYRMRLDDADIDKEVTVHEGETASVDLKIGPVAP